MKSTSVFLLLVFSFSTLKTACAQDYLDKEELFQQLAKTPEDTNRVLLYISLGQQYENNRPDSAIYYYSKARELSEQLDYVTGLLKYYSNITYVFNAQSKFDTALQLNLKSVEIARERGTSTQLAACLGNVANSYLYMEKDENAIDYFLKAGDIIEQSGNKQWQCVLLNNLAITYIKLKQPFKAREYAERAVAMAREAQDMYNLGVNIDNLALALIESGEPKNAIPYLEEGLEIANKTGNIFLKESILINMADSYRRLGEFDKIRTYAEEGAKLASELEDISGEATAYLSLGYYYFYRNDFQESWKCALFAESKFSSLNMLEQLGNTYTLISHLLLVSKDFQEFQNYQQKNDSVGRLVVNEQIIRNIQELEAKYENEKKVQQIEDLEQEKAIQLLKLRQNRFMFIILIGIIFTILTIGFLLISRYRQKQLILTQEKKLQKSMIQKLESEKQLNIREAALKGQDAERTRLASDLHDSLGGMLSGIKLSFMNLKDIMAKSPEDQQLFDRALDMLDGSIVELRRVAHNLMPETLLKFGLDKALDDYCNKIADAGTLNVSYQSINLENLTSDQSVLITIYRIVQEMINNVMKHASATNVYVQLALHDSHLTISVEDDGIGFDTTKIHESKGIGLSNIQNRVDYLNGTIEYQSEINKGTSIQIDIQF